MKKTQGWLFNISIWLMPFDYCHLALSSFYPFTLRLINRISAFWPGFEALMHPEILRGHFLYIGL